MTVRNQVLVVDDDDDLRETIVEILADTGFDVRQAENGAAALTWLRETHGPAARSPAGRDPGRGDDR
ncbi:MAG TPA: response regulator, partial [Kofleriaceae bacterium]